MRTQATKSVCTALIHLALLQLTALGSAGCVTTGAHEAALERCREQHLATTKQVEDRLEVANQQLADLRRRTAADSRATQEELAELRQQRRETEARLAEFKRLTRRFQKMIDAGKIKVYFRRGRMMVALPSAVLFPSGKAELSKPGMKALSTVAETLKEFSRRRFIVAGHTDNVPIRSKSGEFKDNWELSTARALTVTRFLITQGFSPRSLAAAGYGKYDPVRSNRKRGGRRRNRRIELILVPNIKPVPGLPGAG